MDDRALANAIAARHGEAFEQLVQRETAAVYRTCFRILRDPSDAEDAAQETFVAAYRAMGTYRGDGSLRAWLARIAVRRSLAIVDRRRQADPLESVAEPAADNDGSANPERAAMHADRQRQLIRLIAELPQAHREVVALMYFGERTLSEISEVTGRPLGTVKTHLHRGLEQLRRSIPDGADL